MRPRPAPRADSGPGDRRPPDRSRDFVACVVPLQEEMMREHRPALQVLRVRVRREPVGPGAVAQEDDPRRAFACVVRRKEPAETGRRP